MSRSIQFTAVLIVIVLVSIGCESMTNSSPDSERDNEVLSETNKVESNASSTIIVSGDTFNEASYSGWVFNRDPNNQTPFDFTTDEASIGNGSLYIEPITNTINGDSDKFIGELFLNEEIANISSLSYDFLIGNGGEASDEHQFYLNIYSNFGESDFDKFYDCRYDLIPQSGSTSDWTSVTFDLTEPQTVVQSGSSPQTCPSTPADMGDGSTIRVAALNLGDTSSNDDGLDGYYDNVVLDMESGSVVYNFEPAPSTRNECKKGGWKDYGFKNQGQCIRYLNTGKDSR